MSPEPASAVSPKDMGGPEPATGRCSVRFDTQPPSSHEAAPASTTDVTNEPEAGLAEIQCAKHPAPYSTPDSNNATKSDPTESELSDVGEDAPDVDPCEAPAPADDIGEVLPDHWSGEVPIFKPTMRQFKDFKLFMEKVDSYGMRSGIIKIIPPQEWKDAQPDPDDLIKQIRVRDPIKQEIMGSNGTYRQVNFVHQRSYTLRQWRDLCEQSEHQPPARRGERRLNSDRPKAPRPKPAPKPAASSSSTPGKKRGRGRPPRKQKAPPKEVPVEGRPMTPVSDKQEVEEGDESSQAAKKSEGGQVEEGKEVAMRSIEAEEEEEDVRPPPRRMGGAQRGKPKTQSTSARRKYSRREGSVMIDEEHFKDFEYRMDVSDFTAQRCEELERVYWKTLTYAAPLYGADLMGTLFDDRTEQWNLNKLPNLLDVLGTKVPGVNTAYLYLGMWKATFAWHLEDVDLYSINYLHFGAPKQWYSISQADARRFEAAMKSIWPTEGKACDQFLRHKSFLISPSNLLSNFGIKVNKCVSYPGEFVVTYPYGYHSGYNLGYNCAEAVNFALDSWLPMGKIAKKCDCSLAQDSVWIDVHAIERKLRGEETDYEETEDEEEEEDEDEDASALPTPPDTTSPNVKTSSRKRKRASVREPKAKKLRLRVKVKEEPPCCLCPNDIPGAEILPTEDGSKAHRMCALYLPETFIETADGAEVVMNVSAVSKERKELRCLFCRSKRGACFQCSQKTCARAYHATCAAAAGVFVEEAEVPVFGDDGTEYKEQAFEFSCRFHRTKRDKRVDGSHLEADNGIRQAAKGTKTGEVCQFQYFKGDIFAGIVAENRRDEETFLVDIIPKGERIEVEWKWLLLPDPSDFHLPKASPNALPLPNSRKAKKELNAKRAVDETPRKGAEFAPGYTWTEFSTHEAKNSEQAKVDLSKEDKLWFYLGENSTDAKAQYTGNLSQRQHNPKSNFLNTIPKPPRPSKYAPPSFGELERPYVYKPRVPAPGPPAPGGMSGASILSFGSDTQFVGSNYTSQASTAQGGAHGAQTPQQQQQARPNETRVPGPVGVHAGHVGSHTGNQAQNGQEAQNYQYYQSYQSYQNAQGYQAYQDRQGHQSASPSTPQPQSHQPQATANRQTAPAGTYHTGQVSTGAWPAGYNPGYGGAYRSGPPATQGPHPPAANQPAGPAAAQRVHTPTTSNQPTPTHGQAGPPARPANPPTPHTYWPGYSTGNPYGGSYSPNGGQYPQPGASAPPASYRPAYPPHTTGATYPTGPSPTVPATPPNTAYSSAPNSACPPPPAATALGPAPNHAASARPQPGLHQPFEPYRAPAPPPTNVQYDKVTKPVLPPVKQSPVPLPAKYLAAMAKPKTETPTVPTPTVPTSTNTGMSTSASMNETPGPTASAALRTSTTPIPLPPIPSMRRLSGGPANGGAPGDTPRDLATSLGQGGAKEVIELPDVPADSSALVERMLSNLHRVSGRVDR